MRDSTQKLLDIFISLLQSFLSEKLAADQFKKDYMRLWREYRDTDDHYQINVAHNDAVDRVFSALDCFCSDPLLHGENDLNEEQLRHEIEKILPDLLDTG